MLVRYVGPGRGRTIVATGQDVPHGATVDVDGAVAAQLATQIGVWELVPTTKAPTATVPDPTSEED